MKENVVCIRCSNTESVLMTLGSIVATAPASTCLVLLDNSEDGATRRVQDLLNMALRRGFEVYVIRDRGLTHMGALIRGLEFGRKFGERLFHFDEDVVVMDQWWHQDWDMNCIETMQMFETTDLKGHGLTGFGKVTADSPGKQVTAAGFTVLSCHLRDDLFENLRGQRISIFDDVFLCNYLRSQGVESWVREGLGFFHCTRDTGGKYVSEAIKVVR